ncbi:hypothetical protein NKH98_25595 [Mesorhizobium sp. M0833]|uniref:hypothetical protein n=1 Tax=Mesorhizobium sp. M0833 TaxID=2957009 RepID=UPI003335D73B
MVAQDGELGWDRNSVFIVAMYLFLICAGSYATNLGMVRIGADDPPTEAGFCFWLLPIESARALVHGLLANTDDVIGRFRR